MEAISIFDIFKIGIGPSSSHTLGPWRAARVFLKETEKLDFNKIEIYLYGSLSKTGKGHATDKAIQLGLLGYRPEKIKTKEINSILNKLKKRKKIFISRKPFYFNPKEHIIFTNKRKIKHPNTIKFKIYLNEKLVKKSIYYSLGGGFITKKGNTSSSKKENLPYPIQSGEDLKKHIKISGMTIPEIVMQNERHFKSKKAIKKNIKKLFNSMKKCILKGVKTSGILPGGLHVVRRSKVLLESLTSSDIKNWKDIETAIKSKEWKFNEINQWVSCFAMAVNEENAAMGRIVTAPTNGAAGVIPSVLLYYYFFVNVNLKMILNNSF